MLSPGKHGVNFYMCSGEDPRIDPYDYGKVFSFGFAISGKIFLTS